MKKQIQLYNSLTRQLEAFRPQEPNHVKLYVCGPTVYDEAHLGHARCYLTWDVLVRFLQFTGYTVSYVRNITDVDDKIIVRAAQNQESTEALTTRYTTRFHEVMTALNILPPMAEPKATEYIPAMISMIETLLEKDHAYPTPSGSVYFAVQSMPNYGNLLQQNLTDLQANSRIEGDDEKRNALDFALWKSVSSEELVSWQSPWGKGRPGWHLECSAMSTQLLGNQLDIHAGGMDLLFPHHQNEIAQSECATGCTPFSKYWLHNGFVNVSGEKMSKSLGNFATVAGVLEAFDANTIRYFLLTHHYRSPVDFNEAALQGAQNRIQKIKSRYAAHFVSSDLLALQSTLNRVLEQPLASDSKAETLLRQWFAGMAQDMNTAQALSALDGLFGLMESLPEAAILASSLSEVMGFCWKQDDLPSEIRLNALLPELNKFLQLENASLSTTPEAAIVSLLEIRLAYRASGNWAAADKIREALTAMNLELQDSKDSPTAWRLK
jgi:cysteinyl-tRNA synthetase